MSAPSTLPAPSAASLPDGAVLLRSDAFFVRRIPLDAGGDAAMQAELAIESSAPFALTQLYYGFLRAEDGASALVFATHRRLFPEESWDGAPVVLPAFAALLGAPPAGASIRLWRDGEVLTAVGWDGAALPAVVLARPIAGADEATTTAALIDEVQRRLGVAASTEEWTGPVRSEAGNGGQTFTLAGKRAEPVSFSDEQLATMDVRDKTVLAERRTTQQRDRLLWRVFLGAVGVLALAGLLEAGMFAGRALIERQRAVQRTLAPEVEKIQTAQALGARIEEMAQRRLRAFEMLTAINGVRPAGVMFTRAVTNGRDTLEVEGQSANSDNVGTYETALRGLSSVAAVEFPDVRLREGVTTFQFSVRFKDGAFSTATAAPAGGDQ